MSGAMAITRWMDKFFFNLSLSLAPISSFFPVVYFFYSIIISREFFFKFLFSRSIGVEKIKSQPGRIRKEKKKRRRGFGYKDEKTRGNGQIGRSQRYGVS
jgi:hypothetical protein